MRSSVFVCAQSWRGILSTVVKVPVYSFHKKNPQDSSSHVSSDPVEIPVDLCESIGEALAATQTRAERHHTVLNQFGKKKLPTKHFFQFFVRPAGIGHPPPILRILLEESRAPICDCCQCFQSTSINQANLKIKIMHFFATFARIPESPLQTDPPTSSAHRTLLDSPWPYTERHSESLTEDIVAYTRIISALEQNRIQSKLAIIFPCKKETLISNEVPRCLPHLSQSAG